MAVDTIKQSNQELIRCLEEGDAGALLSALESLTIDEQRRAVEHLSGHDREQLLSVLPAPEAAVLLEHLAESQAVELLEDLEPNTAANIVHEMPETLGSDLLREMDAKDSSAILAELADDEEQSQLLKRVSYRWDTAGGLMTPEVIAFPQETRIGEVLRDLGENADRYSDQSIQYVYVIGLNRELVGVLRLRDLVIKRQDLVIANVMIRDPDRVTVDMPLEELEDVFEEKHYLGLPVIDETGALSGILSRAAVQEALAEQQTDSFLKSSGIVSGEELRSMPLIIRCRRRLTWLAPNIVLNIIAASVIALYEDTLQAIIALAVFLPIVSDMSGCSGNQAVAVSIRELTLGLLRPADYVRVVIKEGLLGLFNGLALGFVLGFVAAAWKGNVFLGLVIGGSLALNTMLSVLIGGLVPLLLKRFKVDPALASGPILTTCTDMCGFFLVLNFATVALTKLT